MFFNVLCELYSNDFEMHVHVFECYTLLHVDAFSIITVNYRILEVQV